MQNIKKSMLEKNEIKWSLKSCRRYKFDLKWTKEWNQLIVETMHKIKKLDIGTGERMKSSDRWNDEEDKDLSRNRWKN